MVKKTTGSSGGDLNSKPEQQFQDDQMPVALTTAPLRSTFISKEKETMLCRRHNPCKTNKQTDRLTNKQTIAQGFVH